MLNNRQIGTKGEEVATKYIENLGYQVLQNNYRTRKGEIDIVAVDNLALVFIEVKLRKNLKYGYPVESIGVSKIKTIKIVAQEYIKTKNLWDYSVRFDVIEVFLSSGNKYQINLIKNAF